MKARRPALRPVDEKARRPAIFSAGIDSAIGAGALSRPIGAAVLCKRRPIMAKAMPVADYIIGTSALPENLSHLTSVQTVKSFMPCLPGERSC